METLTTALSTLSLNIIDSDDSTLQKGRRDSSSRLVRTYSNCSYAMVGTFRHPAERRTTTLPAVRGRQTAGGCPASRAAVPTFHPRGIPTHTTLKRVTSGAPRSNPHPLSSSIRGPCGRDNKVYEIWSCPEVTQRDPLKCTEKTNLSCGKDTITLLTEALRSQTSCSSKASTESFGPPHRTPNHNREMCITRHTQPSPFNIVSQASSPGGNYYCNPIRLHPPVGHKVATYV